MNNQRLLLIQTSLVGRLQVDNESLRNPSERRSSNNSLVNPVPAVDHRRVFLDVFSPFRRTEYTRLKIRLAAIRLSPRKHARKFDSLALRIS